VFQEQVFQGECASGCGGGGEQADGPAETEGDTPGDVVGVDTTKG
jgi:hypothetical protein